MKITKGQLIQIIREEVCKKLSLNEITKVTLPTDYQVASLQGKTYMFEYHKFNIEPSVSEIKKISDELLSLIKKFGPQLGVTKVKDKEASVYIRGGGIAVGIQFTSNYTAQDMDSLVSDGILTRN